MKNIVLTIAALALFCVGTLLGCASSDSDQAAAQQRYAQQGYSQQGPQGAAGQGYAQPTGAPMGGQPGGAGRGPGGPGGPGGPNMGMLFTVIDANGDGRITVEEFQAFQSRDFTRRDADHDQSLSREEFTTPVRPPNQGMPPGGAQPAPMQ